MTARNGRAHGVRRQVWSVAMLVLGAGERLALIGVAIGIAGALLLCGTVAQLLSGIAPTDPLTFIGVPLSLAAVAVLASLLPAQHATRVEPLVAMRAE